MKKRLLILVLLMCASSLFCKGSKISKSVQNKYKDSYEGQLTEGYTFEELLVDVEKFYKERPAKLQQYTDHPAETMDEKFIYVFDKKFYKFDETLTLDEYADYLLETLLEMKKNQTAE